MSEHWNIQINIQKVRETPGQPGGLSQKPKSERTVTNFLNLAITAGTETEAYAKAHRMLAASRPERAAVAEPEPIPNVSIVQYPISERAGAHRALLTFVEIMNGWVETSRENRRANGEPEGDMFAPEDILKMASDTAREMGLPEFALEKDSRS